MGRETLEAARALGRYVLEHARDTFDQMGADAKLDKARYLVHRITRVKQEALSKRELFQLCKGRAKTVEQLDPVLALLVKHGSLRERLRERGAAPGRPPGAVYEVNPVLLGAHAEQAEAPSGGNFEDFGNIERQVAGSERGAAETSEASDAEAAGGG